MTKKTTLTAQHTKTTIKGLNGFARHSRKETRADNEGNHRNTLIDDRRTNDNITVIDNLQNKDVAEWVDMVYQDVLDDINSRKKDKRPSRMVTEYHKLLCNRKQPEPLQEFVFAVGSSLELTKDGLPHYETPTDSFGNVDVGSEEWNTRRDTLVDFTKNEFPKLLPHFEVAYAEVHLDETNPHVHIGGIFKTPNNNSNSTRNIHSHTPGLAQSVTYACEVNGTLDKVKTTKNGKPIEQDGYRVLMDDVLKMSLLNTYNKHSKEKAERRDKRDTRQKLTMQEYKHIVQPINDVAFRLSQALLEFNRKLKDAGQKMEEFADELDESLKSKFKDLTTAQDELGELSEYIDDIVSEVIPTNLRTNEPQDDNGGDTNMELINDVWESFISDNNEKINQELSL